MNNINSMEAVEEKYNRSIERYKKNEEIYKRNEEITKKFYAIEVSILNILEFTDLFDILLSKIKEEFNLPFAWITMIDNNELSSSIRSLAASEVLKENVNVVEKKIFMELAGATTKPLLVNKDLSLYSKLIPHNARNIINSMAIAPIFLDGEIIGSFNQADIMPDRFQPGIDTSALEQLALKVSLCLSNVTAHEKLKFLAYRDPLTGLLNRRVMEKVLKREFGRYKRYATNLSVVFIDLDDFKLVNDKYGHDRGDNLLLYVAEHLIKTTRDSDVVSRFAGDEFVVILPETKAKMAEKIMNRLQQYLLDNPLCEGSILIPVSISFGVASTEDNTADDHTGLLKLADKNLYIAKSKRKKLDDIDLQPRKNSKPAMSNG